MTGKIIGHYRIESRIGKGGMGIVYRAEDLRLHRTVALKFLPAESLEGVEKARFIQEAETAARLSHPNICPIYELVDTGEHIFFAMANIDGRTLDQLVDTQSFSIKRAVAIAIQVANGLEEAHHNNVIHRDIKPPNIILTDDDHAYLLDFGIALLAGANRLTVTGGVIGTPSYMAPEQAQGLKVDHRADIWSLGVILFEMLTGKRPFDRETMAGTVYATVHQPTPELTQFPNELAQIIEKTLAKNPEERWSSARELSDALRRFHDNRILAPENHDVTQVANFTTYGQFPSQLANQPTTLAPAPSADVPTVLPVTSSQSRRGLLAGATASLALVAGGAVWYTRQGFPTFWKDEPVGPKHIAILPFEVFGNSENMRAVCDGLVEMFTSQLSQSEDLEKDLLIVPASEIRARKITTAEEARRIYGATLVVTGSTQVFSDTVAQFTVNLINAVTMRQLGSRSFEFNVDNPIGLYKEALSRLLNLLRLQLSPNAAKQEIETQKPAAYTEYLKGSGYLARYDVAGNKERAVASFLAATKLDENYALAFAGLGEASWRMALDKSDKSWADRAIQAATQAVKLDGNLAIAHATLGEIYAQNGRHSEAISELQAALKIEPGNTEAHRGLAGIYLSTGRFKEAEQEHLQVTRFRPSDWYAFLMLGVFYWGQNRFSEAENALTNAAKLTPDNDIVHRNLAGLYMVQGKYPRARTEIEITLQLKPSARSYSLLGLINFNEHRFQEAASALEKSVKLDNIYYIGWGNLGSAYRFIPGSEAKAKAAFNQAIDLAQQRLVVTPKDYNIRANLAEYRAKLGDAKAAMAEIAQIPNENKGLYWERIALAYEVSGQRQLAIQTMKKALSNKAQISVIKDDPDMERLLADPALANR